MAAWISIVAIACLGTRITTAFVHQTPVGLGISLPVQATMATRRKLYYSSRNSPGLKNVEGANTVLEEQPVSFDPFNYAKNQGAELSPSSVDENANSSLDDDHDHNKNDGGDIGIWAARAILLAVAILWGKGHT